MFTNEIRFKVRLAGYTRTAYVRNSRRFAWMWVQTVSWNGDKLAKFRYGQDEEQGFAFSKIMAETLKIKLLKSGYKQVEIVPVTKLVCGHVVQVQPDGGEGNCDCIKKVKGEQLI